MNRTKSSISLRSLAYSLKQSINLDQRKSRQRQFIPLRSSASTVNLTSYNKQKSNNHEDYLILMGTRKLGPKDSNTPRRSTNHVPLGCSANPSQSFGNRKQILLQMTRKHHNPYFCNAQPTELTPFPRQYSSSQYNLQMLEKQYNTLKVNLEQNFASYSLKNYNQYLDQAQKLSLELKHITCKQQKFNQLRFQLQNRLFFLQQQIQSIQMNFAEDLAEKQYCQEFLMKYRGSGEHQFRQQAKHAIEMIEFEYETEFQMQNQRKALQNALKKIQTEFKEWKIQENIELKQRRFKNKFKQSRIQLMRIQQDLDQMTDEQIQRVRISQHFGDSIRKVRQYVCAYFKRYNQLNINHISHGQIADGMDIFLCKQGLIGQFSNFLRQSTHKLSLTNGTYSLKLTQYCDCLKKIQSLFASEKNELNNVLLNRFQQQITLLKQRIQQLMIKREKKVTEIQDLRQQIERVLAQQTLSMIQFLNKSQSSEYRTDKTEGFLNIHEIKSKVKQLKLEQIRRINRARQIYNRSQVLQHKEPYYCASQELNQHLIKQKQNLRIQIKLWQQKTIQIQQIRRGYEVKKGKQERMIEQAIQRMRQKDDTEKTLQALLKQIQSLKRQKIQTITLKHQSRTKKDGFKSLQQNKFKSKQSRQTDRLNIIGRTKNIWSQNPIQEKPLNKMSLASPFLNKQINGQQIDLSVRVKRDQIKQRSGLMKQISKQMKQVSRFAQKESKILNNNTQSSPRVSRQIPPFDQINDIMLSRFNLVECKNLPYKNQPTKRSASTYQLGLFNQWNEPVDDQLLIQSHVQSLRGSKNSKKSSTPHQKSNTLLRKPIQNNLKGTLTKNQSNRSSKVKLSLNANSKTISIKNKQNQHVFSKTKRTQKQCNLSKNNDVNSVIYNKLLRR